MFDWLSDVKREEMMRWRALFKDVDRNVMRTFACIKRLEERTTKYVRIVSNKKKTYKKTTLMRQVITSIPFNCIKDKSVAESIDDAMRVHELDCRSPRHTSSILT